MTKQPGHGTISMKLPRSVLRDGWWLVQGLPRDDGAVIPFQRVRQEAGETASLQPAPAQTLSISQEDDLCPQP